ncbi:heterokaryon incompatibility protein-domain-containing protein [Trametes gibbosa]|nr:heterokaryon incompatibility protein-domain-containing protein [Trametes gibbosa]
MPRFLNTWTGQFEWHNNPQSVRYAILSHTWQDPKDGGEQTYSDIIRIQAEVTEAQMNASAASEPYCTLAATFQSEDCPNAESTDSGIARMPSPFFSHQNLSQKIAMACKVAREGGHELLWIDACCIDKSSSAELAEAINSMYEWYRLSDVCYAYLADVPHGDDPAMHDSHFRQSRWHKRGWTLQELIAPERVVFLTQTWTFLGSKKGLATTVEARTGVDFNILVGRARVDSVSVARRMSWTAGRETTRVEDGAYSLLGIFGVHMGPIYGEGNNAFLRLQEEILRTVPDQTIFVWRYNITSPGLLATFPSWFEDFSDIRATLPAHFASLLRLQIEEVPPLHAIVTPQGVRLTLMCFDLDDVLMAKLIEVPAMEQALQESLTCDMCKRLPRAHLLAFLQCQNADGDLVALLLHRAPPDTGAERGLHVGPRSLCSYHCRWDDISFWRVVCIPALVLKEALASRPLSAVDVFILRHHSHPPPSKTESVCTPSYYLLGRGRDKFWPEDIENAVSFEFDPDSVQELEMLGFYLCPLQLFPLSMQTMISFVLSSHSVLRPWTNNIPRQRIGVSLYLMPASITGVDVVFSVVNCAFYPLQNSGLSTVLPEVLEAGSPESPFNIPTSFVLDTTSGTCVTEGMSRSRFQTDPWFAPHTYVLATADFAIPTGAGLPDSGVYGCDQVPREEDEAVHIRWLRVRLQLSPEHPDDRLRITVELSDVHTFSTPSELPTPSDDGETFQTQGLTEPQRMRQPTLETLSDTVDMLRRENSELKRQLSSQNEALATVLQRLALVERLVDA